MPDDAVVTVRFTEGELQILDAARKLQADGELNRSQYIREKVIAAATEAVVENAKR